MTLSLIYAIIIFIATFLGALAGLGGGVVIKPVLDLIGKSPIDVVNFLSSCAVFAMSISSTARHIRAKTKIDFKFVCVLSVGAVAGGTLGTKLFEILLDKFDNTLMKGIQGVILGTFLVAAVVYVNLKNRKSFNIKNPVCTALAGLAMGAIASFLGVGGGPINVAFLVLFFSMTMKEAAVYSVVTIFFSQGAKIISTVISENIPDISLSMVAIGVLFAVAGGIFGAKANKKANEKTIKTVFSATVTVVAVVNYINGVSGLILG